MSASTTPLSRTYGRSRFDARSQVLGKLAEVSLRGSAESHLVVWKDGAPFAAFPHVEGELADRSELQNIPEDLLYEPPPPKLPRHARRAAKRR